MKEKENCKWLDIMMETKAETASEREISENETRQDGTVLSVKVEETIFKNGIGENCIEFSLL